MERQFKRRLISVLEEGIEGQIDVSKDRKDISGVDEHIKASELLLSAGYLLHVKGYGTFTSLQGRDYLYRLKHRIGAWLKENWFPAIVAAATIFLALGSVVVQVVGLILD